MLTFCGIYVFENISCVLLMFLQDMVDVVQKLRFMLLGLMTTVQQV